MDSGGERTEQGDGDSEQEETEQYEVERIIDMRTEEGEVLYRVRWKNYASDDDTWEPEAHLEDCREVLLAYKRQLAEAKAKREEAKKMKLPMKSDVFDADSSDSDKDRPRDLPIKKKKKKKSRQDSPPPQKEKRKKKKEKRKDDFRPRPAPESDEEEEEQASSPPSRKSKTFDSKKRVVDSDDEDELPVPSKKHRKDKSKDGGKQHKEKKGKDLKGGKHDVESSEDEVPAPADEEDDELTDDSQMEDSKAAERMEKASKKKSELKLKGFKDFLQDKKKKPETPSDNQKETKKALTSSKSQSRDEAARHSSDSSDSSTLHKKTKSKGQETVSAPPKVPSSASSTSSSSSLAAASTSKAKDEESRDEVSKEKEQSGSTNLFEKFLLNCEAKDRVPRKPSAHPPAAPETSKAPKLVGKIEKRSKTGKDSATQKTDDKAEKPRHGDLSAKTEEKTDQDADTQGYKRSEERRFGEDSRERRERLEEGQRGGERWERRTPSSDVMERRRKREDSEPRLAMSCDDNQDAQDTLESEKSDKGQASLSLGMDLNLDWMTLDEFQKHLNGEDEILSAPPLSPIELRDAVKSGDYMSVKLALNSKEDYNLDQEACTVDVKSLIDGEKKLVDGEKSSNSKKSGDEQKSSSDESSDEQKDSSDEDFKSSAGQSSSSDEENSSDDQKSSSEEWGQTGKRVKRGTRTNLRSSAKVKKSQSDDENSDNKAQCSGVKLRSSDKKPAIKIKIVKTESSSGEDGYSSDDDISNGSSSSSDDETDKKTTPSDGPTVPLSKSVDGKRKYDKKHICIYCNTPHIKISRHLLRRHAEEEVIIHIASFPKGSEKRKMLLHELRNKGDYKHNYKVIQSGKGEIVPKKRPTHPTSVRDFLPCQFCSAFHRKSDLWRHERACKFKKGEGEQKKNEGRNRVIQTASSRLFPLAYATGGCEEIIHKMNQDEIAVHIRNDPLICKFGNALSARHDHDKSQFAYIAQKMRELGRFMLAVKEMDASVKYLHELFLPSRFQLAVEGAKKASGFDAGSNKFKTTSLVSKIGYSLKRAAEIAFGESRMTEDGETEGQIKEFIKLIDNEWNCLFSRSALNNLQRADRKEPDVSSLTEDLVKLHTFLKNAEDEAKRELLESPTPSAWKRLSETLLTEVVLFNKSRGGDAGKLLLETYIGSKKKSPPATADVLNRLTWLEVVTSDKLTRMELEGNGGRKMPLLLNEEMISSIDVLNENREKVGVSKNNPFVFGRLEAVTNMRGSDCVRKTSQDCKAKTPDILTSSRVRKWIACLYQLLNLKDRELLNVVKLVGRNHEQWCYILSEDHPQLELLGKQALALDRNFETKRQDTEGAPALMATPLSPVTHRRRGWSTEEQAAVKRQLAYSISSQTVPGKRECDACIEAEPVLQSRSWKDVKNYVHNTIKTVKRKSKGSDTPEKAPLERNLKRKREDEVDVNSVIKTTNVQGGVHGVGYGANVPGMIHGSGASVPGVGPGSRANIPVVGRGYGSSVPVVDTGYGANVSGVASGYGANVPGGGSGYGSNLAAPGYGSNVSGVSPGYGANVPGVALGYGADVPSVAPGYGANVPGVVPGYGSNVQGVAPGYGSNIRGVAPGYGSNVGGVAPGSASNAPGVAQGTTPNALGVAPSSGVNVQRPGATPKSPRKKGSWSADEQAAVRRQFQGFASMVKAPGKKQCDACIAAEPALSGRTWKEVKNYVHNTLQTMKKKGCIQTPQGATVTGSLVQVTQKGGLVQETQKSEMDDIQNTLVYLSL